MEITFNKDTNKKLYNAYNRYSKGKNSKEVLFPLCLNEANEVNLGNKISEGKMDATSDIPYDVDCCPEGKRIGSIHTHPINPLADDIDLFPETELFSQSDLFGSLAVHINKDMSDSIHCAMEPTGNERNEEYTIECKRLKNVDEEDLKEVERNRKPDPNRVLTSKAPDFMKKEFIKLVAQALYDYPFGEKLPIGVISGLKKEKFEEFLEKSKTPFDLSGIIYPLPDMQQTDDIDMWLDKSKELQDKSAEEKMMLEQKMIFWRKADAASIEHNLKKKGKITVDRFSITCKIRPILRKTKKGTPERYRKICDFSDKKIDL